MLPYEHRLRRSADFGLAVRRGRRASRKLLTIHLLAPDLAAPDLAAPDLAAPGPQVAGPISGVAPARAGLVVGKGVGGSVVRSRTARRLRHLLHSRIHALPPGAMLVVRAGAGAGAASSAALAVDLDGALASATRSRVTR